jgi:breast cancer 2 susceptibility protein
LFEGEESVQSKPAESAPKCLGFSSASGKKIEVSDQALEQAKKLFESEESVPSNPTEPAPSCLGFSSASGKKIEVSDQALEQAQKLFKNDEVITSDSRPSKPKTSETFGGFSSAGGKKIQVSTEALKQAKRLFESDEKADSARNKSGLTPIGEKKIEIAETNNKKLFKSGPSDNSANEPSKLKTMKRKLADTKNVDVKRTKSDDRFEEEDEVYKNVVMQMDTQMFTDMDCLQDSEGFSDVKDTKDTSDDECLSPILTNPFNIEDDLTAGILRYFVLNVNV